jgi:tetratricopeptide (TPR) repeat protein
MLRLGRLYVRNGDNKKAAATFEKILKSDPDTAQVIVELAGCLIRTSAYSDAQFHLDRAIELRPGMASAFITYARLYECLGDAGRQISFMMLAANSAPDKPEIRLTLAEQLNRYGDFNGAVAQFRLVLEAQPDLEVANFALGTLLMKQNDLNGAMKCFRKIISTNPGAFDAHFNLAGCLFRQRKFAMAISHFRMACRKSDLQHRSMYLTAQCHFRLSDFDQAIVAMEKLVELDEKNISYWKSLAEIYEAAGEYDQAVETYRQLTVLASERPEFIVKLAEMLLKQKDFTRAEKSLDSLFRQFPGHLEGHRLLGELYSARGLYKEAIEEYQRTLMINENCMGAFAGLAVVYRQLANDVEEQKALMRSVELGCENPETLLRLGELERKLKLPACLDRFRRITELAPDSNCAREAEYYMRHKAA